MQTQCTQRAFGFQQVGGREIVARFDGGRVTSDGGGILLREIEERFRLVEKFAADHGLDVEFTAGVITHADIQPGHLHRAAEKLSLAVCVQIEKPLSAR